MAREVHLVGSVGLNDAETVFTTVSEILGSNCSRIPDRRPGQRYSPPAPPGDGAIVAIPQFGGLRHRHERRTAWAMQKTSAESRF